MIHEGDNMMGVKRNNRSATLRILHEQGSISRKRLAESIKLTPAAITKIVGEMIDDGLLVEGKTVSGGGAGRREVMVELNSHARCALGILINLKVVSVSAVWLDGSVIFTENIEIAPNANADETVEMLSSYLDKLVAEHKINKNRILGLGLAVRGITSPDGRTVRNTFGALKAENYPLADKFEALTGYKVVMANNVRALFLAQMFMSRDNNVNSQFFLRCEYGIGASLSIHDKIWHGGTEQCAEIGHIPVVKRGGKPCACGKSGCLETIASATAILEDAKAVLSPERTPVLWNVSLKKGADALTIFDVLESARSGDDGAATIVENAVSALGSALKTVIYVLDPEKIVLYGRMFENSYYLAKLLSELREGVDQGHNVMIERSRFNQLLEDKAAGLLMVESFFDDGGME